MHEAEFVYLDILHAKINVSLSPAMGRYNRPVDEQPESANGHR
jgi:hypothetical protein